MHSDGDPQAFWRGIMWAMALSLIFWAALFAGAGYILWGTAPSAPGDPHHSHNPASVMYPGGSSLDILPEDFAFARVTWMQWLRKSPRFSQVVVPGLAR